MSVEKGTNPMIPEEVKKQIGKEKDALDWDFVITAAAAGELMLLSSRVGEAIPFGPWKTAVMMIPAAVFAAGIILAYERGSRLERLKGRLEGLLASSQKTTTLQENNPQTP